MRNGLRKTGTVARVAVLESIRRKDPYVVLILGAAMVLGAGLFSHFGVEGLEKFVKDVGLTVTTVFSIVICVVAAARQLPAEIENRTLYPSLGKPISRTGFYLGKYVGVGLMSSAVVVAFFLLLRILLLVFGISVGGVFYQALYLRVLSMWFVAAGVLCLSLFVTHSANVTISLLACMGMQIVAHSILYVHDELTGVSLRLAEAVYWVAPHLELFDLSKKVIHGWPPVPWWALAGMTLYAVVYAGLFFTVGCARFRRMPL
ncbi:MAG: ABC transporter permease [Candidatus Hydrogenedentes bacterium]|nr:ABC transporter permease [Candidatus Hydrogenedentota bacterium]